ncbi:uncharacterized protein VP01_4734g1 [Puccinia sorghi]|uniref:Retrovirus-related Pol polyprotein from transposon TNT 1-94-like beta-barrel domain-containing protein n=1 Tax=Puccinia sorghi TaxID=27349 RepID=A0A0L6UNR2_9BASI|nr:uncharacterized protein VP01_4734g1 [Puccinia sorghi]
MSLLTLWLEAGNPNISIVLDSGDSEHIYNNDPLFDNLEKGKFDVIKTGKQNTVFPVRGKGTLCLTWVNNTISLQNCLLVPKIVINLIRNGELATRGCILLSQNSNFSVSKNSCIYFGVKVNNGLFIVNNSDYIGKKPEPELGIPKRFWHKVHKSCCLSFNQIPRKGLARSPWEIAHNRKFTSGLLKKLRNPALILNQTRSQGQQLHEKGEEGK